MNHGARPAALDLALPWGTLRAHRFGDPHDHLVLGIPGLAANSRWFDYLGQRLAGRGRQVLSVDLRGRGHSTATGLGTYGWLRHARDVLEVARQLGRGPVDLVGHSMGAFVAMQAAALAPEAIRRVVLIDAVGRPDPMAAAVLLGLAQRLVQAAPSVPAYLDRIRQTGVIQPWNDHWARAFEYELERADEAVAPRTSTWAVLEDVAYAGWRDPQLLWPALTMPVLFVRAARPVLATGGRVVPSTDRDRFLDHVPAARAVEIAANHFGVLTHPATSAALADFLTRYGVTSCQQAHAKPPTRS